MKKLLMSIIAVWVAVMMAGTSWSKSIISDSELDEVTAEEGVSVNFCDFSVSVSSINAVSWGDGDGYSSGAHGNAGYAGMSNTTVTGNAVTISNTAVIDVGSSGSETRVNVDLPTINLGALNATTTMKVSSAQDLSGGKTMGVLNMRGFQSELDGSFQVYAH